MPPYQDTGAGRGGASDERIGILVANLGTPEAPTPKALRVFLREFLSDRRVIDLPRWKWWPILHLFILPFRASRSAAKYRKIWTQDGSPLRVHTQRIGRAVSELLQDEIGTCVHLAVGMRYGRPSIPEALRQLKKSKCKRLVVLPLFPQYSHTTVGSVFDAVDAELGRWPSVPDVRRISRYHDDPTYITAIVDSVREAWTSSGKPERLVFSFHGVPQRYIAAGDPYASECQMTARLVATELALDPEEYVVSFQSTFGREEWTGPATESTVRSAAQAGIKKLDVICPGFAADCLETLEEIGQWNRDVFLANGGHEFRYIRCLNDGFAHAHALAKLVHRALDDRSPDVESRGIAESQSAHTETTAQRDARSRACVQESAYR